jgi:ribosomal protein L22
MEKNFYRYIYQIQWLDTKLENLFLLEHINHVKKYVEKLKTKKFKMIIKICSKIKYIKISTTKLNNYILKINNKTYKNVLSLIKIFPYKIKNIIWKFLNSIIDRIKNIYIFEKDLLYINKCYALRANISERKFIHAKGKVSKHEKKSSHIYMDIFVNIPVINNININN